MIMCWFRQHFSWLIISDLNWETFHFLVLVSFLLACVKYIAMALEETADKRTEERENTIIEK